MNWFAKLSPWSRPDPARSCGDVVAQARQRKAAAERTRGEVDLLTGNLDAHRRKNHFGESLERVFRGVA